MSLTVDKIEAEVLKLPSEAHAELLHRLLLSLEAAPPLDEALAQEWMEEAERRDQAMESGEPGIPAEEVFRRLRSSLG